VPTGSEATTAALRIARRATGRRRIARAGYHGWHDWCLPLDRSLPAGLDAQVLEFDSNDPHSLDALFDAHPGQIAAVILAPEMVSPPTREAFHAIQDVTLRLLLHPRHMWFISYAHKAADIDTTLEHARSAMKVAREQCRAT
jgi:glutamate-1-semialdehyde aminotransferase